MVTASGARYYRLNCSSCSIFFKTILTHVNYNIYIYIIITLMCV